MSFVPRKFLLKIFLAGYVCWGAWAWYIGRPVRAADGWLAPDDPRQGLTTAAAMPFGRWLLTPRASYRVTARILGIERYRFDTLATLVPEDLALGWGPLSDNRVLNHLDISQSGRFFFWHSRSGESLPLPKEAIIAHAANTHVIPADSRVAKRLARLRPGEIVTLTGLLVDGRRDDGVFIKTSLTRTDTGAGACEVMLVQAVEP